MFYFSLDLMWTLALRKYPRMGLALIASSTLLMSEHVPSVQLLDVTANGPTSLSWGPRALFPKLCFKKQ